MLKTKKKTELNQLISELSSNWSLHEVEGESNPKMMQSPIPTPFARWNSQQQLQHINKNNFTTPIRRELQPWNDKVKTHSGNKSPRNVPLVIIKVQSNQWTQANRAANTSSSLVTEIGLSSLLDVMSVKFAIIAQFCVVFFSLQRCIIMFHSSV